MDESALRVIQKLLSRAESTEFDSERESCLAKVAELMARHSIEEALLADLTADDRATQRPTERILIVPAPYAARKVSLYGAVGQNCGCTVIDIGASDRGLRQVALVGFPGDLERAEVLITSLLVQMTTAMLDRAEPNRPGRAASAGATAAWRRSFITGFTTRVNQRLSEARRAESARADASGTSSNSVSSTPGSSVALVLARREAEVDTEVRRRYPHLRSRRMDAGSSAGGHHAGRAAGDRARLGSTALGARRALPGS